MLRLTGGGWRGRKIPPPLNAKTRPSTGRVREALFNSLGAMDGLRCLDLFAGSGALGLEAASRGAAEVWLVERHRPSAKRIRQTADAFAESGDGIKIIAQCAHRFLSTTSAKAGGGGFDIIFMDPPFDAVRDDNVWRRLLTAAHDHLADDGIVYLESARRLIPFAPWREQTARRAGGVYWHLWRAAS